MKNFRFIIIISLIVAFTTNAYSQSTDNLDKKNGFQNFKFNTKIGNYSKYQPKEIKEGYYELQDISSVVIGDYKIEKIELLFKDDLLRKVKICLDDIDRTKNEVIYRGLLKNYGKQTFKSTSSVVGTYSQNMIWKGEYTSLTYQLTSFRDKGAFQTKLYLIYLQDNEKKDVSEYL